MVAPQDSPHARTLTGPFASVSAAFANLQQRLPGRKDSVKEKVGDVNHPGEVCDLADGQRCAQLMGVGIRNKRAFGMPIRVYSLGMYVDAEAVAGLEQHAGKSDKELKADASFLSDIKNPDIEKELRLVMTTNRATGDIFWTALNDALLPRLPKDPEGSAALKGFKGHFDGVNMRKGDDLRIVMANDGEVTTLINGKKRGSLNAPVLTEALMDVYLGDNGPSPSLQQDFLSTAAGVMSQRARSTSVAATAEPAPAEATAAAAQQATAEDKSSDSAAAAPGKQVMPKGRK